MKLPLIHKTKIHTLERHYGYLRRSTIGRMPDDRTLLSLDASLVIPTCVLSFKVSISRRRTPVRPVLPTGQTVLVLLHLGLRSWALGFVDQPRNPMVWWWTTENPRRLGVASISTHDLPRGILVRPWLWGSTKKPSMTSYRSSCHHATRTWSRCPPGHSNQAYFSAPHLETSPASTFRACSLPAPTPIKPQPAPTILGQESVHTTLSITHHTRKQSSTIPRTTQALTLFYGTEGVRW
jgi:hypothetical protein